MAITIEIWRSVTSTTPEDFTLLASIPDASPFSFVDTDQIPQALYIYKARRHDSVTDLYTDFSPLVFARGAWPIGVATMALSVVSGRQSILATAIQADEVTPAKAAHIQPRISGDSEMTLDDPSVEDLNGTATTESESVPGESDVSAAYDIVVRPEIITDLLCALMGAPSTSAGGGTAPLIAVGTPSTTGGTLLDNVDYYFKTAYIRSDAPEGYTLPGPEGTANTGTGGTNTNKISIASPAAQTGATTYAVYVGTIMGGAKYLVGTQTIGSPYLFTTALTAGQQALAAIPVGAYNIHTWSTGFSQLPITIVDKQGATRFVNVGCRCAGLKVSFDKTGKKAVSFNWDWKALNQFPTDSDASCGLNTAAADVLAAFGLSQVWCSIAGGAVASTNGKMVDLTITPILEPVPTLNGYRGPLQHAVTGMNISGSLNLYFDGEAALKSFFGVNDNQTAPYGATRRKLTTTLTVTMRSEINSSGFYNQIIFTLPKIQYKKNKRNIDGPTLTMQGIDFVAQYNVGTGVAGTIKVHNALSNGTIITPGTSMTVVPANGVQPLVLP